MLRHSGRRALIGLSLVACFACASSSRIAFAQQEVRPAASTIQYKSEGPGIAAEGLRVFGILAVVLGLATAGLWYARRRYPALALGRSDGARIKVLESRRISPRLSLILVEVDGARVLLGQSGDRVTCTVLSAPSASVEGPSSS